MKKYIFSLKKGSPVLTISPLRFKIARKNKPEENTDFDLHDRENNNTYPNNNNTPLNLIEDLIVSRSKEEGLIKKDKDFLLKSWLIGQIKAITSQDDEKDAKTFVFAKESLLHFEVLDHKFGNRKLELLYLLVVQFERSNAGSLNENFEIGFETDMANLENFDPGLGKLQLGDPVSLETFVESKLNGGFKLDVTSLSWMEMTISDVSKSKFLFLNRTPPP
jgi:peroxin-1